MNKSMEFQPPLADLSVKALLEGFVQRRAKIGVIGLGYVGLPLALTAIRVGFPVLGFDTDASRVVQLNKGHSNIKHITAEMMGEALDTKRFKATADFALLDEPDAILICVPTPLTRNREPDLSFIVQTGNTIAKRLRPGQLIILESTTYPGTTDEVLRPILEAGGLKSGRDFFLAYSPEREDPGNPKFNTSSIPKVIGGDGDDARNLAEALYQQLVVKTVPVSTPATAEAVKLTENIFRAVNIALVNELKTVYSAMGIDVWEVIEAAKSKPFGYMPFYPGPGLGGHCIPIDPFYLTWKAREHEIATRFIELAGEVNTRMPYAVLDRLVEAVDRIGGRSFSGARILVLGVAYKKNVDDIRESPSLKLIELIEKRGAVASYHDPYVDVLPVTRDHPTLGGRRSTPLTPENLAAIDAVLIATDHDNVDYRRVVDHAPIVVDTRNACHRAGLAHPKIVKA